MKLSGEVYNFVFEMLDNEPEMTGMEAGRIATQMEKAYKEIVSCNNCYKCVHCEDCTNCFKCAFCEDCKNCSRCDDCANCLDCVDCINCVNCDGIAGGRDLDGNRKTL